MSEINSWWDLEPIRLEPGFAERWIDDYDRQIEEKLAPYAPGGDLWPKGYDVEVAFEGQDGLRSRLGPGAKSVVINDYLAAGQMYVTEGEIILSKLGWEALLAHLDRQQYVREMVSRIVEREMGDVLEWLREAGHDV